MDPPRPVSQAAGPASRRSWRLPCSFDWSTTGRDETEVGSDDRKSVELVQEIRVAQIGVQVLFTILLAIAFAPGFARLGARQELVYVAALVLSATAAGVLLAPVMYHHLVFRRTVKARLGALPQQVATAGLMLLLLALIGSVHLATSMVIGRWAVAVAGSLALVLAALWFGPAAWQLRDHRQPRRGQVGRPARADVAVLVAEISDLEREIQQTSIYPARGSSSEINDELIGLMAREYVALAELSHRLDRPRPTVGPG